MRIDQPRAAAWAGNAAAGSALPALPALPPNDHPLALDPSRTRLLGPNGEALSFPTDGSVFTIGREPHNALQIDHAYVSRQHAHGTWRNGKLWICDTSSNGTFVNGQRAPANVWQAVPPGGILDLAGCRLTMALGGSQTIMARLDHLKATPDQHQLRLGDGSTVSVPEPGTTIRVGRQPTSEVHLTEGSVSRSHADLRYDLGRLYVRDAGSTYGTYLNGQKVESDRWTEVPEGMSLQFGRNPNNTLTMEPRGPLLVTFFGDSSTPDIGGQVEAQGGRFERAISNHSAPALVRGTVARGSALKELGLTALPALCVAEAGAGGALAIAGATLAAGGAVASGLALAGVGIGVAAFGVWAARSTRSMWKGGIEALKKRLKGLSVQPSSWKHVQQAFVSKGPSIKQFSQLWAENQARYPTSRHVVFLSGHGDQKGAAGLKYSEVGQVVKGADAIFLDACNGAQIESLSQLTGSARVAVASEHTVRGYGFPLDAMFGRSNFPDQPRDLGAALVQAASQSMPAQSLVAVDLKVMKQELYPALEQLGRSLRQASQNGLSGPIKQALDSSLTPSNGPGGFGKKIDLGSFLARLGENPQLRSPELSGAQAALNKTILSMVGNGTVSFDRGGNKALPAGFSEFLSRI